MFFFSFTNREHLKYFMYDEKKKKILIFYFSFCDNRVKIFTNGHVHPHLVRMRMRVHALTHSHANVSHNFYLFKFPMWSHEEILLIFYSLFSHLYIIFARIFFPSRRNTGSKFFGDLFLNFYFHDSFCLFSARRT